MGDGIEVVKCNLMALLSQLSFFLLSYCTKFQGGTRRAGLVCACCVLKLACFGDASYVLRN